MDVYRNVVRKQVIEWLNAIGNKKHQEWLIVHVSTGQEKNKHRFRPGGGQVFDKLKNDFNLKQVRCVQVRINGQDSTKDQETWTELVEKMKESILACYNNQLIQFDEEARKLDSRRLLPGWNYCQYFLLKVMFINFT